MTAAGVVGEARPDEPRRVVVVLDQPVTCEKSRELGRLLGASGFTGRFVGGSLAELAALGAKARREAGEADG